MSVETARAPRRLRRIERPALAGVLAREIINFSSYWRSTTFSATVEPTIYLVAFGFGFGSLVSTVGGYDYVEFVGTGTVATAVLFSSAFAAMFGTFIKYQFQRTYDAILAAPVDTEELVTAEVLWIATRAGIYGCVPMLVAMVFGLDPRWTMIFVPVLRLHRRARLGQLRRAGLAPWPPRSRTSTTSSAPCSRRCSSWRARSSRSTSCPDWAQTLAQLNPLYHLVQLVRHAAFGFEGWSDLGHLGALVAVRRRHVAAGDLAAREAPDRLTRGRAGRTRRSSSRGGRAMRRASRRAAFAVVLAVG